MAEDWAKFAGGMVAGVAADEAIRRIPEAVAGPPVPDDVLKILDRFRVALVVDGEETTLEREFVNTGGPEGLPETRWFLKRGEEVFGYITTIRFKGWTPPVLRVKFSRAVFRPIAVYLDGEEVARLGERKHGEAETPSLPGYYHRNFELE